MAGTTRDQIHATVGSITISWNPHHRSVEYPSWFRLLSTTSGECKRRPICLWKDLNEIFLHHSRCVCPPPFGSEKGVSEPHHTGEIMYGYEGSTCHLKKAQLKRSVYCEFSSTTFRSLGSCFFSTRNWAVFSAIVSCFWMFCEKRM